MQLYVQQLEQFALIHRQKVGDHMSSVDDGHGALADNLHARVALDDERGVFVDADSEQVRILSYDAQQATEALAFGKMLVDDRALQKTEPCSEIRGACL